jgi:hypothetical protein
MSESDHILDRAEANQLDRPDRPRDDAGRFASKSAEPETGRTADLHQSGFRTLAEHKEQSGEEKTYGSDDKSLREAHADLVARRREGDGQPEFLQSGALGTAREAEDERKAEYIKQWRDSIPQPEEVPPDVAFSKDEAFERISQRSKAHAAEAVARPCGSKCCNRSRTD